MRKLINKLYNENYLSKGEILYLLNNINDRDKIYLINKANDIKYKIYKDKVFIRGLIEFTNYCKRNCAYCGIRLHNKNATRYRLTIDEIMKVCIKGDSLGYKTFVLQGGEDDYYNDERMIEIIYAIKNKFKDSAVTLSIGEKSYESYKKYYDAGADRYLLRHETASKELYEKLHPNASFENRQKCLWNLKKIGYQVGAGFMVGLPGQTNEDYAKDLIFLKQLNPHMVGIGPFISHKDTPLRKCKNGTLEDTVLLLALIRLLLPHVLLPATTALGTINPCGREKGLKAGANVLMPNLSPMIVRKKYSLYDGKVCTGYEGAECIEDLKIRINKIGLSVDMSRGDNIDWTRE